MNIRSLAATTLFLSTSLLSGAAFAQGQAELGGPEGAASAAAPAPATAPNPQVVAFVDQQFPLADADKDGTVTAAEFTAWITSLKTAEQQKEGQVDAAAAKAYADNSLIKADSDKDGKLSKEELIKFFGG